MKDSRYSHSDCLETREFSQTCSSQDLTPGRKISQAGLYYSKKVSQGTRRLLEENQSYRLLREKYQMKMEKFNRFFDDIRSGLIGVLESYQKADDL